MTDPVFVVGAGGHAKVVVDALQVLGVPVAGLLDDNPKVVGLSCAFSIGSGTRVEHGTPRQGDVRDSLADISKAREAFGFEPKVDLYEGLVEYVTWAKTVVEGR